MVREAEEFAAEDEANRKRIEALNGLSSFVYSLKNQVTDEDGLGGKLDEADRQTILDAIKETTEWLEEEGAGARGFEDSERQEGAVGAQKEATRSRSRRRFVRDEAQVEVERKEREIERMVTMKEHKGMWLIAVYIEGE